MSRIMLYLRKSLVPVLGFMATAILFTACLKNDDDDFHKIPASGLMAANLAPDQESMVITLSGNVLTQQPLGYSNFTGGYRNVYTGTREVAAYDYPLNQPLATVNHEFKDSTYYSLFVVGFDGHYRNVIATDDFDNLSASSGKAYVRYVNAIVDTVNTALVSVAQGGSTVINDNAAFGQVGEFTAVDPGDINIAVKQGGNVDVNRTITVEEKKVYTILLQGVPGETSEPRKVQIKYITNGTLTDEDGDK